MNDMKDKKKYPKPKLVSLRAKVSLVASIIVFFMFLIACFNTIPTEKEACKTVTTEFDYCKIVNGRYVSEKGIHIYCTDSQSYYVAETHYGYGRKESIEALSKGTFLTVTYDTYDGQIVELTAEDNVIFSYSDYVKCVEKDRKAVIFFTFFMLFIIGINIVNIYKEKHRYDKKHTTHRFSG